MTLFYIIFKTIFFYFFVVLVYRIMGKREIGQLGVIDLIVSILIAELVAISIENASQNIIYTIFPVLILMLLEIGAAFVSMKSKYVRKLIDGKASLIVYDGKVNYKEMIKQRYSLDDLLLFLRQKGIKSIEEVEFAFLEKNGTLSVFRYEKEKRKSSYPMALVLDGCINDETLINIKKNRSWLIRELKKKNIDIENVFYAFYNEKKLFIIKKSEI